MSLTRFVRGSDYVPGVQHDVEPVEAWTGTDLPITPTTLAHGHQTAALKIARQVSAAGTYPDDGTGTIAAQANASQANVTLPSDVLQSKHATLTPVGMLLAGRYGTGPDTWEVVRVTGWNSSTGVATAHRNLAHQWPNGAKFHLLIDVRLAEWLTLFSEFSANTNTATVAPIFFPWIADGGALFRAPDLEVALDNSALTASGEVQETSYYLGRLRSRPSRGHMGAKVRVVSLSAGNVSLWAGKA